MLALVRNHHLHTGGLAHYAARRLGALIDHLCNQAAYAYAADFFVITKGQVYWALERA